MSLKSDESTKLNIRPKASANRSTSLERVPRPASEIKFLVLCISSIVQSAFAMEIEE